MTNENLFYYGAWILFVMMCIRSTLDILMSICGEFPRKIEWSRKEVGFRGLGRLGFIWIMWNLIP